MMLRPPTRSRRVGGSCSAAADAMSGLPFAFEPGEWLEREPRAVFEEGAVFRAAAGDHDPRVVPLLTVAWLDEPEGVTLEAVVEEDVVRLLSDAGELVVDHEDVRVGGVEAVRTFVLRVGGVPTASEQWRLLTTGRRWTVSATTALCDQPEWGPRLAGVAATFRVR
jgi:hypothetical protein